ncbi:hypothetical protein [Haloferax larsenii]|uniref:Uncharacterized protein n=2 Tax=Haloferax TaxID=2251 RepID=A0A1H7UXN7_HALLR|nr:hypothetical protein [Haloferax larsenii]SEM01287.1 hypothetical protein SAMN04488691_1151 [Haloferax larsenii]
MHCKQSATNKARFKSVIATSDPIKALEEFIETEQSVDFSSEWKEDHYSVKLSRKIERSDRTVSGSFALFRHGESDVWTALTGHGPDFFKRGIKWILRKGQPELSNFYVSSEDLESVLKDTEKRLSSRIFVNKAVVYSHKEEGNISWETRPYRFVFDQSKSSDRYVDKLTFEVRRNRELLFDSFVSRSGVVKFTGGDVNLFFNNLLRAYANTATEKVELFSEKARSRQTGEIKELEIQFNSNPLQDPDNNRDLIDALANLSKSSLTIYHNNPYAHISVLDLVDGSNCDVFVTSSDTISIIPGFRGSMNSLIRISDQIAREFQEGKVVEKYEQKFDSSDFVHADL